MSKVSDWLVQDKEEHDDCLHRPLFPVNVRLYNDNAGYRSVIQDIVEYMFEVTIKKFKDYPTLRGLSGANVGIPYNIVVLRSPDYNNLVYINPVIIKKWGGTRTVESNCGSLNLKEKIEVERHKKILVSLYEYDFEIQGPKDPLKQTDEIFTGADASTMQHEIDHNNGILITNPTRKRHLEIIKKPSDIKDTRRPHVKMQP